MKINNVGNNFSFGSNQKTRFIPKVVKEKVAEFKEKQELKKEIKQVYDAVYLSKKQDADLDELNFVKPKLYFRDISCVASCILGDNIISLKKDFLDKNNWYILKELSQDFEDSMFYTDKIALAKLRHLGPINRVVNIDKYELLEKDELLLHIAAYLAHELEHAYLFQTVLSTTGGKKMFFDGIKEYNSKAKFGNKARTLYPFCIFYKPTKPLPFDK